MIIVQDNIIHRFICQSYKIFNCFEKYLHLTLFNKGSINGYPPLSSYSVM